MPIISKIFDLSQLTIGKIQFISASFTLISIALFILQGIALFTMCKHRKIEKGWLSFVPIANLYILGKFADLYAKDGKYRKLLPLLYIIEIVLFILFIVLSAVCLVSVVANVQEAIDKDINLEPKMFVSVIPAAVCYIFLFAAAVIYTVFHSIALWRIYAYLNRKNAVLFLVLSVVFGFLAPVFLFCLRNKSTAIEKTDMFEFEG